MKLNNNSLLLEKFFEANPDVKNDDILEMREKDFLLMLFKPRDYPEGDDVCIGQINCRYFIKSKQVCSAADLQYNIINIRVLTETPDTIYALKA